MTKEEIEEYLKEAKDNGAYVEAFDFVAICELALDGLRWRETMPGSASRWILTCFLQGEMDKQETDGQKSALLEGRLKIARNYFKKEFGIKD